MDEFVHRSGHVVRCLAVLLIAAGTASNVRAVETLPCGVWVVRNALQSRERWHSALLAVERLGCRRVYLQVSGRWDAFYASRVFVRPERGWQGRLWDDPVGEAIAEAHARGIEVHVWVNALLAWSAEDPPTNPDHVYLKRPDWFVARGGRSMRDLDRDDLDAEGLNGEGWFLDPARPEVRTELRRFILELAGRYPLDGVHLDYIRYPAGWLTADGGAAVTRLVGLIRADLRRVRPQVVLSAAVMPVPSIAAGSFGQPWEVWLAEGLLDEVVPMIYRGRAVQVIETVRDYPRSITRSRLWVGMRIDRLRPADARRVADELRADGIAGTVMFSHNFLETLPAWRSVDRLSVMSGGFGDLARANATRTDPGSADTAFDHNAHVLQVRQEPPAGLVVGVADPVSGPRALTADRTDSRHGFLNR